MPKEASKDPKRTPYDKKQQNNTVASQMRASKGRVLAHAFSDEHQRELTSAKNIIAKLTIKCEQMEKSECNRNNAICELKQRFENKVKAMRKIQEKFEILENEKTKLIESIHIEKVRNIQLVDANSAANQKVKELMQELSAEKENCTTIIAAKEAECSAYLKELKTRLDKAISKQTLMEAQVVELQNTIADLEAKLEIATNEVENKNATIEHLEAKFLKKQKKLAKRDQRIAEIEEKIVSLEAENKEYLKKLEIEGRKMRELQNVLDRPYRHVTPVDVENSEVERQEVVLQPVISTLEQSNTQSTQASTLTLETTIMNTQIPNNRKPEIPHSALNQINVSLNNKSDSETEMAAESDEDLAQEDFEHNLSANYLSTNRSTVKAKTNQPNKRSFKALNSEEFLIPPYVKMKKVPASNSKMSKK